MNTERQEIASDKFHMRIADQIFRMNNPQNYLAYPTDVVIAAACKTMGIDLYEFKLKVRNREYVDAKILVATYLYTNTNFTLRVIGDACGKKDHATVLHYVKKHLEWTNDKIWQNTRITFTDNLRKFSPNYSISMSGVRGLN